MKRKPIELRPRPNGDFDELVATGADVHFEMMDSNCLWVSIGKGKQEYHLFIGAKGKLSINVNDESVRRKTGAA